MARIGEFIRRNFLWLESASAARAALGILTNGSTTGSIWYVDSVTGSAGGAGTVASPTATIKQALVLATASKGDIIVCFPGHAETIVNATDLAISKAGVTIIGLGDGADRATITYGTSTTANIPISAASVVLKNIVLKCNIDQTVAAVTISAADVILEDVEIRDGAANKEFVTPILTTSAADRLTIRRLYHNGFTTGTHCTETLSLIGVDGAVIDDCRFFGKMSTASINFLTTACTDVVIRRCTFHNAAGTGFSAPKIVSDTVGGSKWSAEECYDRLAGDKFYGSQGSQAGVAYDFRYASVTSASPLTTGTLFTFTGAIEIVRIIGTVVSAIQNQLTNTKLSVVCDALAAVDVCSNLSTQNFAVGSLLQITGTAANAMSGAGATAIGITAPQIQLNSLIATCVTSGTITVTYGAASTGSIRWDMVWRPLTRNATVL